MREILFTTLLIAVFAGTTFAQKGTTLEEYRYVSKGYEVKLKSGLDMKEGYRLEDLGSRGVTYNGGEYARETEFKALYREGESEPCALMMILKRTDTDFKEFLCIPHPESSEEIWNKAYKRFEDELESMSEEGWKVEAYMWGVTKFASFLSQDGVPSYEN